MMSLQLNALFLFLVSVASLSESRINPCLYNREDVLPCQDHFNTGVVSPNANQYTVHKTSIQVGRNGFPICIKNKEGELLEPIIDLGTPDSKFLFSPGAEQAIPQNYDNEILAEYNVQCERGKEAFIDFEALDVEPKNCFDGSQKKCRDYIEIDANSNSGTIEYCGNKLPSESYLVGKGKFTVKFRSSVQTTYPGFRLFVTCYSTSYAIDPNTCTSTGGPTKKLDRIKLFDLAPLPKKSSRYGLSSISLRGKPARSQPITLTSADLRVIRTLTDSLFNVALSQARRKVTSRPFPSYSRYGPRARGRLAVPLSSTATLEAVRYENACNPIVRSVTNSYITVASRLAPRQLETARNEYQQELSLAQPSLQ